MGALQDAKIQGRYKKTIRNAIFRAPCKAPKKSSRNLAAPLLALGHDRLSGLEDLDAKVPQLSSIRTAGGSAEVGDRHSKLSSLRDY